jgi:hypothetical protein
MVPSDVCGIHAHNRRVHFHCSVGDDWPDHGSRTLGRLRWENVQFFVAPVFHGTRTLDHLCLENDTEYASDPSAEFALRLSRWFVTVGCLRTIGFCQVSDFRE